MTETNLPAILGNPAQVQATFNTWYLTLLPIGAGLWHGILKIAPWAKANGGLFRGIRNFLWEPQPTAPTAPTKT